jgi:hypothetical protein
LCYGPLPLEARAALRGAGFSLPKRGPWQLTEALPLPVIHPGCAVNVSGGHAVLASCVNADSTRDGSLKIDELVRAVKSALSGC